MWYLISQDNPDHKCVILGGKIYVVGRKDCDVLVPGDATVSRKHAELSMSHTEANLAHPSKLPILLLKDLSKFGTWVNAQKVEGERILKDGDSIQFGSPKSSYMVVYEPFVMTSSCLDTAAKKSARKQLCIIGGHMVSEWKTDCSLLIMSKISVTIKVICALVSLKPIVRVDYLETYIKHLQGTAEKPDPGLYLPGVAETQLNPSEVSFLPDKRRQTVFQGLTFMFLGQKQFKKMCLAIELGGGTPVMLEEGGEDDMLVEKGVLVMNCTDTELTQSADNWVTHVQAVLDKDGKHMIQDADLGYAVLYCSTEKHCNPNYTPDKDFPQLPSQSLSQVEMYVPNTETQNRTQPGPSTLTSKGRSETQTTVNEMVLSQPRASTSTRVERGSTQPTGITSRPEESQRGALQAVKEEPVSPVSTQQGSRKRGRLESGPDIESESGRTKRVKTEPVTPVSKPRAADILGTKSKPEKNSKAVDDPEIVWLSDGDDIDYSTIDMEPSTTQHSSKACLPNRKVDRKKSPIPENSTSVRKSKRNVSPVPEVKTSVKKFSRCVSPDPETVSSVRRSGRNKSPTPPPSSPKPTANNSDTSKNNSRSRSRSPGTVQRKKQIKTENVAESLPFGECINDKVSTSKDSDKGQRSQRAGEGSDTNTEVIYSRSSKREVIDEEYEQSEIPIEEKDVKSDVLSRNLPAGFLTTRKPIKDQVRKTRAYEEEEDMPSGLITVAVVSLLARRRPMKEKGSGDCPEGFTKWKGKIVRNFKKFKKSHHSGSQTLPNIIGGSDLEVHQGQRSKEMDDWLKESVQNESQHTSDDRRAQELFDFNPNSRRRGR